MEGYEIHSSLLTPFSLKGDLKLKTYRTQLTMAGISATTENGGRKLTYNTTKGNLCFLAYKVAVIMSIMPAFCEAQLR